MKNELFEKFSPWLKSISTNELDREIQLPAHLIIDSADYRGKKIEVAYAPFDHINLQAKIVIVGLTPGRQQMGNALHEAQRQLKNGADLDVAKEKAKVHASFSGAMRNNLVSLLDKIGIARLLEIKTTATLWQDNPGLVQFTSALRYPVFIDSKNYSGTTPSMLNTPVLEKHLSSWFAKEMEELPNAIYIPLGPKVGEAVEMIGQKIGISSDQIISGLPHPSGANAERIAFFLGRKPRHLLSAKTNPDKLNSTRDRITAQIGRMEG
jgi:hypothetical protein